MQIELSLDSVEDYCLFLKIKSLPVYRFTGRTAYFPDEYADRIGVPVKQAKQTKYTPIDGLFDYQRDIAKLAIRKERFAAFVEPGYGKTLIGAEFARHALANMPKDKCLLWVAPLMVVKQTVSELNKFYHGEHTPEIVRSAKLPQWLASGGRFAITNYEAIVDGLPSDRIGGIVLDESSLLKSHYGAWGTRLIEMGKGKRWKLCLTGTPAPNDRIEYANHAIFLDRFPTVNSFLAKYFVNRGMTGERWELKPHALKPFYRDLSHWCIFLSNPSVYGWKDNIDTIPPMHIHIEDVPLTEEQSIAVMSETGSLFADVKGIASRSKLARIAKGIGVDGDRVETRKPEFIRSLVNSWPDESTIVWCKYNAEQDLMASLFEGCADVSGSTPEEKREELITSFINRDCRVLVTKPKILGMGLNLQVCTRMVFSTCQDSYEEFYQAVKRANRVGSTKPLHVYIPVTDVERPMMDNVLRKAKMIEQDTREQEQLFREQGYNFRD